jgi:hypothetical protein
MSAMALSRTFGKVPKSSEQVFWELFQKFSYTWKRFQENSDDPVKRESEKALSSSETVRVF